MRISEARGTMAKSEEQNFISIESARKNLSAVVAISAFWIIAIYWNGAIASVAACVGIGLEALSFVPRVSFAAATAGITFLHMEVITVILASLMREKWERDAAARGEARARAEIAAASDEASTKSANGAVSEMIAFLAKENEKAREERARERAEEREERTRERAEEREERARERAEDRAMIHHLIQQLAPTRDENG